MYSRSTIKISILLIPITLITINNNISSNINKCNYGSYNNDNINYISNDHDDHDDDTDDKYNNNFINPGIRKQ